MALKKKEKKNPKCVKARVSGLYLSRLVNKRRTWHLKKLDSESESVKYIAHVLLKLDLKLLISQLYANITFASILLAKIYVTHLVTSL